MNFNFNLIVSVLLDLVRYQGGCEMKIEQFVTATSNTIIPFSTAAQGEVFSSIDLNIDF